MYVFFRFGKCPWNEEKGYYNMLVSTTFHLKYIFNEEKNE